ncbi:hypothetical protein SmJEL517_g01249 [Synchytrium microbalum]|uniref:Dynein axonemal light chain 1 n=1 Tax=Synchytrium microbalum TaxID=1806994 RepID=A0A507CFL9_9FUNG|nr:uncharacterized protein SmJEL517_g01249 [Synchytrium microbalum]TPX36724.1 hypothetical protein SmJEL517_g01249 [Synchytrium microbalum]
MYAVSRIARKASCSVVPHTSSFSRSITPFATTNANIFGRVRSNTISDVSHLRTFQHISSTAGTSWSSTMTRYLLPYKFRALLMHHSQLHARASDLLVALKKNAPIDDAVLEAYEHLSADATALGTEETIANPSWGLDLIEEEKARSWIIGEVEYIIRSLDTLSQRIISAGWKERVDGMTWLKNSSTNLTAAEPASKGTAIKDAIKAWEDKTGQVAAEAQTVKMLALQPFIVKMDASLAALVKVEYLGLSTNNIEKISNLQGLSHLKILSLGRNMIKKIEGLDAVADTLEELWISYNNLEKLNGVECCRKLKVLYAANNKIKAWEGISCIKDLPQLEELLLVGNPLEEKCTADGNWVTEVAKKFPQIKKLDGKTIIRDEPEDSGSGDVKA